MHCVYIVCIIFLTFEPKVLDVMEVEPAVSLHKVGDTEALWLVR